MKFGTSIITCCTFHAATSVAMAVDTYHVEAFQLDDLQYGLRDAEIARYLRTTGIIAVQMDENFAHHRQLGLETVCRCWKEEDIVRTVQGSDSGLMLRDGQTTRTTLATATAGRTPLPLSASLESTCGAEAVKTLDQLRDDLAAASDAFIVAWDRLLRGTTNQNILLENSHGGSYATIHNIVQASTHLEHFHLYSKDIITGNFDTQDATLAVHTDAGLFLAFVPAYSCLSSSDEAFYVQDSNVLRRAVFPENSVIMMLGSGAEYWLKTNFAMKATRHAVRMQPGESRAWYGMMHLVPQSAIVQEYPTRRTFADMRSAMALTRAKIDQYRFGNNEDADEDIAIGCGITYPSIDNIAVNKATSTSTSRRRLQMVDDASVCNNNTNFYCWMSCLDIPQRQKAATFINEGYSLYCVDPSVMAKSGNVSIAVEPCNEQGVIGGAMNTNCMGSWQPTVPGLPVQEVHVEPLKVDQDEPFCYGGTSMYMDGFQWVSKTCIIYLFPNWILSSAGKLVAACIGSILFGCLMELILFQRRNLLDTFPPGVKRLALSAVIYGLQLTMGYSLMLIIMIYSVPLFFSVVFGLVGGHVLFNAKDALVKYDKFKKVEGQEQATQDLEEKDSHENYGSCCNTNENDVDVIEGSTPCCQHTL